MCLYCCGKCYYSNSRTTISTDSVPATLIRDYIKDNDKACIVITHSHLLLKLLDPSHVHVMIDGEIKLSGGEELHKRIVEDGYPEFS